MQKIALKHQKKKKNPGIEAAVMLWLSWMSPGNSLQGLETNLPAISSISFHGASSLKHHVQSKVSMTFFFFYEWKWNDES